MEWEELESTAQRNFNVWGGGTDLDWAKQAWGVLENSGLTSHENEPERCKVALRFLALGDYYYNFCTIFRGEHLEPEFVDWVEKLNISAFRLGQLFGESAELEYEWDADLLYQKSLEVLISDAGNEIIDPLKNGFGGQCPLFISLWRSTISEEKSNPEHLDYLTDNDIYCQRLPSGELASEVFGCNPRNKGSA